MTTLAEFQDAFARSLADPAAPPNALSRQPGFAVYRNTATKGCIDALQANYPTVCRLVGEEWFRSAAARFVGESLPREPMLLAYGEGFDAFLASFAPAREMPYLAPVARLDRFWTEAHIAADDEAVPAERITGLDAEQLAALRLRPVASARWAWFDDAPAWSIWSLSRAGGDDLSHVDWRGEGALVLRPRDEVVWTPLDAAGCAFLDACASGRPLEAAAASALARDPAADLSMIMSRLLEAGALAASD